MKYCWWKKSCTSWSGKYPIIYRVLYISGGCRISSINCRNPIYHVKEIIAIVTAHRQEDEHQGMLSVISDSFDWRGHKETTHLHHDHDFFWMNIFWKNANRFAAVSVNFHPGMCFCRGTLFFGTFIPTPNPGESTCPQIIFWNINCITGWITLLGINILPILLYRLALLSRWFSLGGNMNDFSGKNHLTKAWYMESLMGKVTYMPIGSMYMVYFIYRHEDHKWTMRIKQM